LIVSAAGARLLHPVRSRDSLNLITEDRARWQRLIQGLRDGYAAIIRQFGEQFGAFL
jgi:hypothetical protein